MKYEERIRWSISVWLFLIFLAASMGWAVWAAFSVTAGLVTFIAIYVVLLVGYYRNTLTIRYDGNWLYVGNAKIERKYLHKIEELDGELMAKARGRQLDPAAFLAIRFWVKTGVHITLCDPRDPTPYWLISSGKTNQLMHALTD